MKARILILIVCIPLITAVAFAHNGEEHVIGTVANINPSAITVRTTANQMVTVAVAPETKFIKASAPAKIADLNVGERVVIHAKEGSRSNLVADTVEFAAAPRPQQTKSQTLTGIVSDAVCGATHTMKNMTAAQCTLMCAKAGQKYALVVGKNIYALEGHEPDLEEVAGKSVTIKGAVSGKTVAVESVVARN